MNVNEKLNKSIDMYVMKPATRVSFVEAIDAYIKGKTIQCRVLDAFGFVKEVENYHISEGLDICLEFNEIINGHFFIIN